VMAMYVDIHKGLSRVQKEAGHTADRLE
jgi:hypothetical protein